MGEPFDVLVVEDHPGLRATLSEVARETARRVESAGSVREALEHLSVWTPSLVLLDFVLPDGTGLDVLTHTARLAPAPRVVAISGEATPEDSFRLARAGVQCFLHKPFGLERIRAAMSEALESLPDPLPEVRGSVGVIPIKDLEANVRRAMVSEALARSGGSLRGAASLLGISRQTLQHILKSPEHEGKIER
jgi:DNA-binding NtrC family response regulator